jgi:protein TonB
MTSATAAGRPDYGAAELKRTARKWMAWALAIAGLVHVVLGAAYLVSQGLVKDEPPTRTVRVLKYSELGPPPSISSANAPAAVAVAVPEAPIKPKIGVPVPVPDETVSPEQTTPTQQEMPASPAPVGDTGAGAVIQQDLAVENIAPEEVPPADFVPFEKEPQVVRRVEPVYPEAARTAGIEGTVWAKLWIDKEGKVRDVVIVKTPSDLFKQPVIDAAKQWVFTPAVMNSGPVAVWLPVSFKFRFSG